MHLDAMEKVVGMDLSLPLPHAPHALPRRAAPMHLDAMEKVVAMDGRVAEIAGMEDMITEIALSIPPTEPARLVRAALASKTWLRLLTSPVFLRAYAERHGRPPFVGYFHCSPNCVQRFVPAARDFPSFAPDIGRDNWFVLDGRQGRLLLFCVTSFVVWYPISGEHFLLPEPPRWHQYQAGAVLCAKSSECTDPDCYSEHWFRVVLVGCDDKPATFNNIRFFEGNQTWACIYSQETVSWGDETYILEDKRYKEHPLVEQNPPVLYNDSLYFLLETHELEGVEVRAAIRFDLTEMKLSVLLAPEVALPEWGIFVGTRQGLAFVGIDDEDESDDEMEEHNKLSIWTLTDLSEWTLTWSFDLDTTLPAGAVQPGRIPSPVGFVEGGESIICVDSGLRIFTIQLDSLNVTDVGPSAQSQVLPMLHFITPSLPKAQDDEETEDGGAEENVQEIEGDAIGSKRKIEAAGPSGKKAKGDETEGEESGDTVDFSSEDSDEDSWI